MLGIWIIEGSAPSIPAFEELRTKADIRCPSKTISRYTVARHRTTEDFTEKVGVHKM